MRDVTAPALGVVVMTGETAGMTDVEPIIGRLGVTTTTATTKIVETGIDATEVESRNDPEETDLMMIHDENEMLRARDDPVPTTRKDQTETRELPGLVGLRPMTETRGTVNGNHYHHLETFLPDLMRTGESFCLREDLEIGSLRHRDQPEGPL